MAIPAPAIEEAPPAARLSQRRIWLIFGGLMLALLMATLDQSIVNPALPTIVGDLHGLEQMEWVITGYLLAATIVLPIYGKLGDLLGRKPMFLFAIGLFLAGSMLTGLSQNIGEMIAFRALQGLGAGGLLIGVQAIMGDIVSPRERTKYMSVFMAVNTLSVVAGPLVGGFFTDQVSWRWCFYVNVPIGLAALAATAVLLPGSTGARRRFSLDVTGAALLAAVSACVVFIGTWGGSKYDWGSGQIIALAAGALVAAVAFVFVERSASDPIMPLRLFRDRSFTLIGLIAFAAGFGLFATIAFIPTFLQMVDGISATQSGLMMLSLMGGVLAAGLVVGRIVSVSGRYKVAMMAGSAIMTIGMALLSLMSATTSLLQNALLMSVVGVGMGLLMPLLITAVQNAAPRADLGVATATNNYLRQIGSTVGAAVAGSVFVNRLTSHLASSLPHGANLHLPSVSAITPALVHSLPAALQHTFINAYATSLPPIFLEVAPLAAAAFVLTWFVREIPLRGAR